MCGLSLVLIGAAGANQADFLADPESLAHGISGYHVEREGKVLAVTLFSSEKVAFGKARIEFDTPDGIVVMLQTTLADIRLTWNPQQGQFTVTEEGEGQTVRGRPTLDQGLGFALGGDPGVLQRQRANAELAFVVMHQTLINLGLFQGRTTMPLALEEAPQLAAKVEEKRPDALNLVCPPSCGGSILVSGVYANSGRALSCEQATQGVKVVCSNEHCFGCCRLLECDYYCVFGTYGCVCSRRGQSCTAGDEFTCDDEWPPECT